MGIFNLGDINFRASDSRSGTTNLSGPKYNSSTFRYPIDLGSADKGHYLLININEQINTATPGISSGDKTVSYLNQAFSNQLNGFNTTSGTASNVVGAAGNILDAAKDTAIGKIAEAAVGGIEKLANFVGQKQNLDSATQGVKSFLKNIDPNIGVRTTRRIISTVALYMPDSLKFNYNQQYGDFGTTGGFQMASSGLSSAIDTYKNDSNSFKNGGQLKNAAPFLANFLTNKFIGGAAGKVLFSAGSGGMVNNPMKEILYSSPDFRSFRFDFLILPRSEKEALEVQNILDLLRFHQAPELVKGSGGFFMYPPSEFDISFYYNGQPNVNLPKLGSCVLTGIDVDYTPNGFSTYEVLGSTTSTYGGTGMPVGIRLGLNFKETEYITKSSPLIKPPNAPGVTPNLPQRDIAAENAASQAALDRQSGSGQ